MILYDEGENKMNNHVYSSRGCNKRKQLIVLSATCSEFLWVKHPTRFAKPKKKKKENKKEKNREGKDVGYR